MDPATRRAALGRALLRAGAIVVFAGGSLLILSVAGDTLGYDYLAYDAAARRLLAGGPLYDTSFQAAGGFGLFYYPPPFILLVLPLALLLPAAAATWAWAAMLTAAFVAGVALLPVRSSVRWGILLLAGLMWPYLYALKLGQVNALLFLAFACGWRWLSRDGILGVSAAVGAAIKLQPGFVFVWALAARRFRAVAIGLGVLLAWSAAVTLVAGAGAWPDFLDLVRRVGDPVTTDRNFTAGAIAYRWGADAALAGTVQVGFVAAVIAATLWAAIRLAPERGYLVAVVASQLISPILWDHYAMLLLLPVAWLLERRQWWAVAVPLVLSVPLVGLIPDLAYLAAFVAVLAGVLVLPDRRSRS